MKNKAGKIFCVLLALACAFSCLAPAASAAKTDLIEHLGDVNRDGRVNSTDAREILRASAKLTSFDEEQLFLADVDSSGKMNSADARILLRIAARLESIEPYQLAARQKAEEEQNTSDSGHEDPVAPKEDDGSIEISGFLGENIKDVMPLLPILTYDGDDGYSAEGIVIYVKETSDGVKVIREIVLVQRAGTKCPYRLFGVAPGEDPQFYLDKGFVYDGYGAYADPKNPDAIIFPFGTRADDYCFLSYYRNP